MKKKPIWRAVVYAELLNKKEKAASADTESGLPKSV